MKQIRAGIIGQGRSGRDIHGAHMMTVPEMYKIVAVSDPLEERRIRAEKEFGCIAYTDYREMAKRDDLDIIINSSPSHLHVPISIELLNMGCNVLCEKPLTNKLSDLDLLSEAVKKSGKFFTVFQNMRFPAYLQKIRKIIDSGVLGRIVQVSIYEDTFLRRWDWQTLQVNNGGTLLNTAIHNLDQALRYIPSNIIPHVECRLSRANTFGDADDYAKIILNAPGCPLIDVEVSSCCVYSPFLVNVQGTCGGLSCRSSDHLEWSYFIPAEAPEQKLVLEPIQNKDGTPVYCKETLKWYKESWDVPEELKDQYADASRGYYDSLYETLAMGAPAEVTLEQLRQQVVIVEECQRQNPLSRMF